jgi:hypothetical protein
LHVCYLLKDDENGRDIVIYTPFSSLTAKQSTKMRGKVVEYTPFFSYTAKHNTEMRGKEVIRSFIFYHSQIARFKKREAIQTFFKPDSSYIYTSPFMKCKCQAIWIVMVTHSMAFGVIASIVVIIRIIIK